MGQPEYIPGFPEEPFDAVPEGVEEPAAEWLRFYAVKRGHHPNARGGFTTTSNLSFMNYKLLDFVDEISPRPILMVVGDRAHSKYLYLLNKVDNQQQPVACVLLIFIIQLTYEEVREL